MSPAVFISFSSKDQHTATTLCEGLEARGFSCWIAPRNVRPGRAYAEEIVAGLRAAKVVVVVLSSHSNASQHVGREIELASTHEVPVIPVRIERVVPGNALSFFLSSVQWFDALDGLSPPRLDAFAEVLGSHVPASASAIRPPVPGMNNTRTGTRLSWVVIAMIIAVVVSLALWASSATRQDPTRAQHEVPTDSQRSPPGPAPGSTETGTVAASPTPATRPASERSGPKPAVLPVAPPQSARCSQLLERVSLGEELSAEEHAHLRQKCGSS